MVILNYKCNIVISQAYRRHIAGISQAYRRHTKKYDIGRGEDGTGKIMYLINNK